MSNTTARTTGSAGHPESPKRDCECVCIPLCACGPVKGPDPKPEPKECVFHVYLSRVKVVQTSGDDPLGENEYTITGTVNGNMVVHPSPTTWINLTKAQGWRSINRFITAVTVIEGNTKYANCQASIIEWDKLANSSEVGESDPANLTLYCHQPVSPVELEIDLHHLTSLPTLMGKARVEFRAYQI